MTIFALPMTKAPQSIHPIKPRQLGPPEARNVAENSTIKLGSTNCKDHKMKNTTSQKITRRTFVGTSAAAAAAFTIVPRSVLGQAGDSAPSQKVNLAFIGVGDKGMGNLQTLIRQDDVQAVAAADVARIVEYTKYGHPTAGLDTALARVEEKNAHASPSHGRDIISIPVADDATHFDSFFRLD